MSEGFLHRVTARRSPLALLALFICLAGAWTFATLARSAPAQPSAVKYGAWGSGTLSEQNLRDLVGQMTLDEKIAMVHGGSDPAAECSTAAVGCVGQAGYIPGVKRLGVPPLRLTDGPAGVRLSHNETALPAPVGLTATFDPQSAEDFGVVEGGEGRATNQDVLLAPMINQVNFPTGGRNFETTGEDPFLAGQVGRPLVKGIQSQGLIATVKHYVENDFENSRQQTNVKIDERTLHETELQAFEATMEADPGAVMCSYNRVNDVYACSNDQLQNGVLRDQLGFSGFIMSDWGATHRVSDLINGLDMSMPSGNIFSSANLTNAVNNGTPAVPATNDMPAEPAYSAEQWKAALDTAVVRILRAMNKAGLLEGTQHGSHYTDGTPYVPPRPQLSALRPAAGAVARDIADKSATLLKNDDNGLPLSPSSFAGRGTVVLGPTATAPYIGGGGSAHVTPYEPVTSPFDALSAKAGGTLRWLPGYDLDGELMPSSPVTAPSTSAFAGQNGWLRQQITPDAVASGAEPVAQAGGAPDQLDPTIDDTGAKALPAGTAWRWRSTFKAPSAGTWQLKVLVKNQRSAQLFVDGLTTAQRRVNIGAYGLAGGFGASSVSAWDALDQASKSHDPALGKVQQGTYTVTFAAGETHDLDLRAYANSTDPLTVRFHWVRPDWQAEKISEAVSAARFAKTAVIFAYDEGTEGADRGGNDQAAGLRLPGYQDDLISAVADANPNTIVVLNTGDPVLMPWAAKVRSILEMWYPGQEGGPATADVLLGDVNPGGKLPVTFPADPTKMPTYDPGCTDTSINGNCPLYPGKAKPGFVSGNHSYREITALDATEGNGIFQGYRWYDRHDVAPLFPFGHGLSYTQFNYSDLSVTPSGEGLDVSFVVRNVGPRAGDEVPQVYVGPPDNAPVPMAAKSLAGFQRITLQPGEARHVTLHVNERSLSYWSVEQHAWIKPAGARPIYVGSSSRDIRLQTDGKPKPGNAGTGTPPASNPAAGGGTPATPAQAAKLAKRAVARLTATTTPSRDVRLPYRFTTKGKLVLPRGVSRAAGCVGKVRVTIKAGANTVSSRVATVTRNCTYSSTVALRQPWRLRPGKGTLKVLARYGGSALALSANAPTRTVRVR